MGNVSLIVGMRTDIFVRGCKHVSLAREYMFVGRNVLRRRTNVRRSACRFWCDILDGVVVVCPLLCLLLTYAVPAIPGSTDRCVIDV